MLAACRFRTQLRLQSDPIAQFTSARWDETEPGERYDWMYWKSLVRFVFGICQEGIS
jgi:hypothetical protein